MHQLETPEHEIIDTEHAFEIFKQKYPDSIESNPEQEKNLIKSIGEEAIHLAREKGMKFFFVNEEAYPQNNVTTRTYYATFHDRVVMLTVYDESGKSIPDKKDTDFTISADFMMLTDFVECMEKEADDAIWGSKFHSTSERLQKDTMSFLKGMRDFINEINTNALIVLKGSDSQRTRLYEKAFRDNEKVAVI